MFPVSWSYTPHKLMQWYCVIWNKEPITIGRKIAQTRMCPVHSDCCSSPSHCDTAGTFLAGWCMRDTADLSESRWCCVDIAGLFSACTSSCCSCSSCVDGWICWKAACSAVNAAALRHRSRAVLCARPREPTQRVARSPWVARLDALHSKQKYCVYLYFWLLAIF